jgi:hypothetical protein
MEGIDLGRDAAPLAPAATSLAEARIVVARPRRTDPDLDLAALSWLRAVVADAAVVVEAPSDAAKPAITGIGISSGLLPRGRTVRSALRCR